MNQRRHGHKQLPQEIYMRRRVAALIGLLVAVILLIVAATSLFGGKDAHDTAQTAATSSAAPRGSEQAPATRSTTEQPLASETSTVAASASATETAQASAEPTAQVDPTRTTCGVDDLEIRATLSKEDFQAGEMPSFYMEAFNPTAVDCTVDLDEAKMRFEVYKMGSNERVWADTDCYPSVQTGQTTFKSGQTRKFQADWSRLRSAEGQCTNRAPSEPGHYFLHTVIGDNYSAATPFNLY